MTAPVIRNATPAEEAQVVDTIVLSFAEDPVARWCWPTPHEYLAHMPAFTRAFGGNAFLHDAAHCTEDVAGAALWLPPGVHPDEEAMGEVMENTVDAAVGADLHALFEQEATYHPDGDYWFLPLIGVDPAAQGKGYGGALVAHALRHSDAQKVPAYLTSSNPRNISLYQRHGFEILAELRVGDSPQLVPMLRQPR